MSITTTPPLDHWIPNRQQLFESKTAIMVAAGGTLDNFGRGEAYPRRVITHGSTGQLMPGTGNILAMLLGVYPGRAGAQQFQFSEGAFGKVAQRFARYRLLIALPWKSLDGDLQAGLPDPSDTADDTSVLDEDGWIVYSALLALAMGGLVTDPPYAPIPEDNVLPAQMLPYGPQGQMAGWEYIVELQL